MERKVVKKGGGGRNWLCRGHGKWGKELARAIQKKRPNHHLGYRNNSRRSQRVYMFKGYCALEGD
jgi:hypothetical protein